MGSGQDLKEKNARTLAAYVFAHAVVVAWMVLGLPFSWTDLSALAAAEWLKAGSAVLVALLTTLLNRLAPPQAKERLVYWRFRHPLPGSRAFSELAQLDVRVDVDALRTALGGSLPVEPEAQNRAWYRLYREHANETSVLHTHRDYLLLRDITWLTALAGVVGPTALLALRYPNWRPALAYFGGCVILYLFARTSAAASGTRFVQTVLGCASAAAPSPAKSIRAID